VLDTPLNMDLQSKVKLLLENKLEKYHFTHTTIEFEQPKEICRDS